VKLNNNWDKDWKPALRIEIFPSANTPSEFAYFTGKELQKINVAPTKDSATIQFGDLGLSGTLEVYCEKPTGVTKNGRKLRQGSEYQYEAAAKKLTLPFEGAANVAIKGAASVFTSRASQPPR
jgi:hypothetical protein